MEDKFVYITINQGYALAAGIEKLKENQYFNDGIAEQFIEELNEQAIEITVDSLNIKTNLLQKLKRNGDKVKVSKSKLAYIMRLTGVDIFDEETMRQHMAKVSEVEFMIQESKSKLR